ncbi:MAG: hypothetical protein KBT03_02495 [Bacteroidales bacterium]|nr:hypothetical protein [Candidatus Scybalousia scybalohippi]
MLIRRKPNNEEKYIIVTNEDLAYELQANGIMPKYIDGENMYFVRSEVIEDFIKAKER